MDNFQHSSATYFNRELSLFEFHQRVLAQALDPSLPVLERLTFLTLYTTNFTEPLSYQDSAFLKLPKFP